MKQNRYKLSFSARCPVNGKLVQYNVVVETTRTIMVEDLLEFCTVQETLHEPFADRLWCMFGGRQTISAMHHGVMIETIRE